MQFVPTNEYTEISLQEGLNQLQLGNINKLYSDGLDIDEYIYFDNNKGFCYEDGCVIGETFEQTLDRLHSIGWCWEHKFYIKKH